MRATAELRLGSALIVACALHAAVLLGIDLPPRDSGFATPALDIRLITESAPAAPAAISGSPRHQAQAAPGGGQGADGGARPEQQAAPAASPANPAAGDRVRAPEGQTGSERGSTTNERSYPELAKEIARAHSLRERAGAIEAGGSGTKRLTGTSAKTTVEAAYLEAWRRKTERVGRANYPPGGFSGELLLLAVIQFDGALEEVRLLESSGYPALDEAALRTVRLAAPYSHFPREMSNSYNRLEIVRRWRFERRGAAFH